MNIKVKLTLALILGLNAICISQSNFWQDAKSGGQRMAVEERSIIPAKYRELELQFADLVNDLRHTGFRTDIHSEGHSLILPLPNGTYQEFLIFETLLLPPSLSGQFPIIKTFSGTGITDVKSAVYLDVTEKGFHAMILSPGASIYIDPIFPGNQNIYACYYKKNYSTDEALNFSCGTESSETYLPSETISVENASRAAVSMRTFDIAISASAEYTSFHGGTVSAALSAITTTLNRVKGIYELELAISFQLVSNNIEIIYTDVNTDPYTSPPNHITNISEAQSAITNAIGAPNFDIGHLFTTGNGGIATVGCTCDDDIKARGVTGSDSPLGDPYTIDFVAHEIGHQLGASHTFNGSSLNCSSNRSAATAYEPGSGSTIMGYAGVCGSQNVQHNTNSYFHRVSLDEIHGFVVMGAGSSCASTNATGNNTPTVNADPNGMNNKYIPANTPFELTASGSDPNGDNITYCWEQYDLGDAGAPSSSLVYGPTFKSYQPATSASRVFPKLDDILDGSNGNEGEFLPSVSRSLHFECSVRDNNSSGGGFAHGSITLNVDNSASSFSVNSHNTSSVVQDNITLNWNVGNTTAPPVSCANVDIMLSTDGGLSFSTLVSNTANDGAETVTLPNFATGLARVKVKCSDNVFFDINNADLRIAPADATCAEQMTNGDLEGGYTGWSQFSSNGYGLIGNFQEKHSGVNSALFGGAANETSQIWQTVEIPAGAHFSALTFWHKITEFDCGTDVFNVKVNGSVVHTIDLCTTAGTTDWEREIVDLSAYQGTSPTVMLELVTGQYNNTWAYLDDFSIFTCVGGSFPLLPVEMIDFQAIADENDVALTWRTARESNNRGFEIEMKSPNGAFDKIGFVPGSGTTNEENTYGYRIENLLPGEYFFRLRQIDINGSFEYSGIRSVILTGVRSLKVFPNPANDMIFFEITQATEQFLKLDIFDAVGKKVTTILDQSYSTGNHTVPFNVQPLSNGIYFYKLSANNFEENGRFVVE